MAIGFSFCDTGSEVPVSIVISVRGVVPMEVSSCANCGSYSFSSSVGFVSIFCFSLWWGGLKMSGLTFSATVLSVVILCIVGASGFAGHCGFSSSITSMVVPDGLHILLCWMWYAYWCNLTWEYSLMFFLLMLCMPFIIFMSHCAKWHKMQTSWHYVLYTYVMLKMLYACNSVMMSVYDITENIL